MPENLKVRRKKPIDNYIGPNQADPVPNLSVTNQVGR